MQLAKTAASEMSQEETPPWTDGLTRGEFVDVKAVGPAGLPQTPGMSLSRPEPLRRELKEALAGANRFPFGSGRPPASLLSTSAPCPCLALNPNVISFATVRYL